MTPEPMAPDAVADLTALHLDALYARDERGRLLNRRTGAPTPRVHFFRTAYRNYGLVASELPERLAREIEALFASEPVEGDPERWEHSEPGCLAEVRRLLAEQRPPSREYRGPAFAFPEVLPAPERAVEVIRDPSTQPTAPRVEWIRTAVVDDQPLVGARDETGRVVSVCHSAALGPRSAEAGLETDASARRRGLALAVTVEWAQALRATGRVPLYSTSWDNGASRAVARRLGLTVYGEDWHVD